VKNEGIAGRRVLGVIPGKTPKVSCGVVEPLVIVVEAAEELRTVELDAVLDAAQHTSRAVILRIIRDA